MRVYKIILLLLTIIFFVPDTASQIYEYSGYDSLTSDKDFIQSEEIQGFTAEAGKGGVHIPLKLNYFAGTDFSWSGSFGSRQGVYAGAENSYKLSPRFRLSAGSFVKFSRFSNVPSFLGNEPGASLSAFNNTTIGFYAKGDYLLTPRLTLTGIAFKEFSPFRNETINPLFLNSNMEGISFELNYKVLENLHFGARFNYIKNDHPYIPYRNSSVIDNYFW